MSVSNRVKTVLIDCEVTQGPCLLLRKAFELDDISEHMHITLQHTISFLVNGEISRGRSAKYTLSQKLGWSASGMVEVIFSVGTASYFKSLIGAAALPEDLMKHF